MNIILAILIFSLIVIIHEFGHYTFARLGGIKVNEFSLGMGPRLFSFDAAGTKWSVKLFPIGGSCAMEGEDSESSSEDAFGKKSVFVRIMTVFGGPLFNFIFAFLLSIFVLGFAGIDKSFITEVVPGSPAYEAGLRKGDLITGLNGKKIRLGRELVNYFHFHQDSEELSFTFKRDGEKAEVRVVPVKRDLYYMGFTYQPDASEVKIDTLLEGGPLKLAGAKSGDVIEGINGTTIRSGSDMLTYLKAHPLTEEAVRLMIRRNGGEEVVLEVKPAFQKTELYSGISYNTTRHKIGFADAILHSFTETRYWISSSLEGLKYLVTGRLKTSEIAGPVGIAKMIGSSYEATKSEGFLAVALSMSIISIVISASLGVMNLLPIPALDGGRLVFLFIEAIRRKKLDPDKEGIVHFIGFVALMGLMLFVFYNDIMNLFI